MSSDPDTAVGQWLQHGAPMGIAVPILPGALFPAHDNHSEITIDELHMVSRFADNHKSFNDKWGLDEAPTIALAKGYLDK